MLTKLIAAIAFLAGFGCVAAAWLGEPERAAFWLLLASASWIFAIGCGVWHVSYLIEAIIRYVDQQDAKSK